MSFLKLGDLIDGGHPVSVGDDGTVFTRLSIDQLGVPADETTTSSQEICVDDLPIELLSDPSFGSLANNIELTVINFEDLQKDGIQDDLSTVTPNSGYNTADNTISFLDLNDYQLDCTSDELLESCLKTDASGIESNQDLAQYLNEDLFITNVEDTIASQDTEQLFHSDRVLNTTKENVNDSASEFGFCPNDSRVLFDIGNLSSGNAPEHQGFIKLTTGDSVPASHEFFNDDDAGEAIDLQAPADNLHIQSDDIDKLLVYTSAFSQTGLEEKIYTDIKVTSEPELINEISQATESYNTELTQKSSNADKEFSGLDQDETIPLLHYEHQGFIKLTAGDSVPESHECFDIDARETINLQAPADNLPRQSDDIDKPGLLVSPSALALIDLKEKTTNYLDTDISFTITTEPELINEIVQATESDNFELAQKSSNADKKLCTTDCDKTSPSLHIELIKVETKDCDLEKEGKWEPTAINRKPSYAIHKCPDSSCDKTFLSEPSARHPCSLVNGPIKPFVCTINDCGLAFRYSSYLERHVRSKHDGVRDHKCIECGHGFITERDLAVHSRKHTGERSEPCPDPNCELTFSTRSIATTHFLVKHSMVKAHKCDDCGKAFGTVSNLKEHGLTHKSVKDFVCLVVRCGRAFKTKGKLKRHSLSHAEVSTFQCKQCTSTFRKGSLLDKHIEKKHRDHSND